MNILLITPLAPYPPDAGVRVRLWEEIKYLGQRHDLTVVSFAVSDDEIDQKEMLNGYCNRSIIVRKNDVDMPDNLQAFLKLPKILQWYNSPDMHKVLRTLGSENFDIVLIEQIFMAQYHVWFSVPVVLMEHNIESNIIKQLVNLRLSIIPQTYSVKDKIFEQTKWMLLAKYENETWPSFQLRVTVSKNDKKEMDTRCTEGKTIIVENGINTEEIKPVDNIAAEKILFMGTLNYDPNVDSVSFLKNDIMPAIWQKNKSVSLVIAGRDPEQQILDLNSISNIEVIANPESMSNVAEACALTVVPLRSGGGTRIKILHSMAMGLPVVSTSKGSEGLMVTDGHDILIRDNPEEFADAVLQILDDKLLRDSLRINGRKLVEKSYDWSYKFEILEKELIAISELYKRDSYSVC